MKVFLASIGLLAVGAFCVFGVLATFEPTDNALVFRIGYGVTGLGCFVGVGLLIFTAVINRDKPMP